MNKVCQKCNQSNPSEAAFCLNCASPLGQGGWQPNQQGNYQNYSSPQQAGQNFVQPSTSGGSSQRATAALVLALAGLFCCGPFTSVPAIIVGWMEINAINQGQSSPAGRGMATFGLWGGVIATLLHIGGYLFWALLSLSATSDPYYY